MRYGTRSQPTGYWTPCGVRPCGSMNIGYEYGYLYTALCPSTGDVFALLLPSMQSECLAIFLQQFEQHIRQRGQDSTESTAPTVRLVLDNAGTHHAKLLCEDSGITLEFLPSYSPELNPVERFFQEVRRVIKPRVFESLKEIEDAITDVLHSYWKNPQAVVQLTYWQWMNPLLQTHCS